jgi:hypothetical protein
MVDYDSWTNIVPSNILECFNQKCIGTKVLNSSPFTFALHKAVREFDFASQRVPGQAVVDLPPEVCEYVSGGVGKHTHNPDDYVVRFHREKVGLFLKRKFAEPCDSVRAVVYTLDAYLRDPDVTEEEAKKISEDLFLAVPTYVLVAVLGSAGPKSPLTPGRFVHNLAGGNNEALLWTGDEIRDKAKEIKGYYNEWCSVAD